MSKLAEIAIHIVEDDIVAKNDQDKVILICNQFGLEQSTGEAALKVLREASKNLEKIRKAI